MVVDFLKEQIEHVTIMENRTVYELIKADHRCIGVKVIDKDGHSTEVYADHIVLAAGGLGQIYSFTSNAETVTGDGIALAYRAGAELIDMEFIQFHPTLIYADGKGVGLASEAIRGEGARLRTEEGTYIMEGVHPYKDLAPRHVVSQTIYKALKDGHSVYLDITPIVNFEQRFPTVTSLCREHGIDIESGRIPVVPGCHFLMGGVRTNINGETTIPGLYAIGENACTGVHGANRLASNSLLEGLYFGSRLAHYINEYAENKNQAVKETKEERKSRPEVALPAYEQIKTSMMERVGIIRTKEKLEKQLEFLESFAVQEWLKADLEELTIEEIQIVFMLICSWLVTKAALKRTESRGGHLRLDYPNEEPDWEKKLIIQQIKGDRIEQSETASHAGTIFS